MINQLKNIKEARRLLYAFQQLPTTSLLYRQKNRPVIAGFTVPDFESASHNPEVAGSNPAPATRRKDLEPYGSKSFFAYFLFLQ